MTNATATGREHTSPPGPWFRGPVEEWLSRAHPSPRTVLNEWASAARLALLPLGRTFEAVRIPERVVHTAVGSDEPSIVAARLVHCLRGGPVIYDPGFCRFYALVPTGTLAKWTPTAGECLGDGTYLGVPRLACTELDAETRASYWVIPMSRPGGLCWAADVAELVLTGVLLSDDEDDAS